MASTSQKKIAQSNKQKLQELHIISAAVSFVSLAVVWFFRRPSNFIPIVVFQLPLLVSQYVIETSCRPKYKYDSVGGYDKLVNSGHDMNQPGLIEYLLDIIYFTWLLDVLVVVIGSNKIWYLFIIIPGYAAFKVSGFIKAFLPQKQKTEAQPVEAASKPEKSKRQQKLEKNGRRKVIR